MVVNKKSDFEWDKLKDLINICKHRVSFDEAQEAFEDPHRIILKDVEHSHNEQRYYCLAKVYKSVMTVRFTYRNHKIRIIGAGYWRAGRKIYEKKNGKIHR